MIARIMGGGGQYRVDDSLLERLNQLDERAVAALERGDEEDLDARLDEMAELVRSEGEELPEDDLSASDIVIPPSDLTLDETRRLLSEDGLIPDLPAAT
ncbi:MAG: PspA-associated protein PspAA [Gaiellaceae bacterium]